MRRLVFCTALLVAVGAGLAASAHAQSGRGLIRGVVLPRSADHSGGFGDWYSRLDPATLDDSGARDTAVAVRITLTPVHTLGCRARPLGCAPIVVAARGMYGRYASGLLSMGEYRMRVEATGCEAVERAVVILSDSQSVEHVALTCAAVDERP